MKHLIPVFVLSVFAFILISIGVILTPYFVYFQIIDNQFFPTWYQVQEVKYLDGGDLDIVIDRESTTSDLKFWSDFHLGDYKLPLPLDHPEIYTSPIIQELDNKDIQLGIKFLTYSQNEMGILTFKIGKKFKKYLDAQELFKIPIIRGHLEDIAVSQIWKDIFSLKLKVDSKSDVFNFSLFDLPYFLYIIYLRSTYFPNGTKEFYFISENETGLVITNSEIAGFETYHVFSLVDGFIENYLLDVRKSNDLSKVLKNMILKNTYFSDSTDSVAESIYYKFRDLPYNKKIGQAGLLNLFSAWTHTRNNEFLRLMVEFLDRNDDNFYRMAPVYQYATKLSKVPLGESSGDANLLEKQLLEKIRAELKEEADEIRRGALTPTEEKWENDEDRFKDSLDKAKKFKDKNKKDSMLRFD